jgi:hypothetical protein
LTGDPEIVSGWDIAGNHAKATLRAAPPGSVYWFGCDTLNTARELAHKLHLRPRSDMYGEKGYGYGMCSIETCNEEIKESISCK